eukprot:1945216-Prymnesium_polylepis.1
MPIELRAQVCDDFLRRGALPSHRGVHPRGLLLRLGLAQLLERQVAIAVPIGRLVLVRGTLGERAIRSDGRHFQIRDTYSYVNEGLQTSTRLITPAGSARI